jgi:hypothetical protein
MTSTVVNVKIEIISGLGVVGIIPLCFLSVEQQKLQRKYGRRASATVSVFQYP